MSAWKTIFCLGWALLALPLSAVPHRAEGSEAVEPCADRMAMDEILRRLRTFIGRQLRFTQQFESDGQVISVGYELNVIPVNRLTETLRFAVRELVEWSHTPDGTLERAAIVSTGITDFDEILSYSSNERDLIRATDNLFALAAVGGLLSPLVPSRRLPPDGDGVVIHRLHTHPEDGAVAHSARDIFTDLSTYRQLKGLFGHKVRFISHVIPVAYGGDVVLTFDPVQHRVY